MEKETNTRTVYEIGFHLIPRLAEAEVPGHVDEIKEILNKAGAELISDEFPNLIDLAYPISKTVSGTKEDFDTAYFGWIKFEADPASLDDIDESVRAKAEVLRFILIKTLREDTRVDRTPLVEEVDEEVIAEPVDSPVVAETSTEEATEEVAEDSPEETAPKTEEEPKQDEVDKAIDDLVKDTE